LSTNFCDTEDNISRMIGDSYAGR